MLELKDLEVTGTLTVNTLMVATVTTNMINGITPTEFSYLKNSNGNIQERLTDITTRATNLVNGWK